MGLKFFASVLRPFLYNFGESAFQPFLRNLPAALSIPIALLVSTSFNIFKSTINFFKFEFFSRKLDHLQYWRTEGTLNFYVGPETLLRRSLARFVECSSKVCPILCCAQPGYAIVFEFWSFFTLNQFTPILYFCRQSHLPSADAFFFSRFYEFFY